MSDSTGNAGVAPPSRSSPSPAGKPDVVDQLSPSATIDIPNDLDVSHEIAQSKAAIRKAWTHGTPAPLAIRALDQQLGNSFATTTEHGTYVCACCANDLFSSKDKFVPSGEAARWPSFHRPISSTASVGQKVLYSFGMKSVSLHCAKV
jgi:peptide methionine sulfoxide reductase MsrB